MEIRYSNNSPSVDPAAYVAPTAVLSGQVRVGPGSCVLHGAVVSGDGGRVDIGANCVIMDHAVLRGTPRHPVTIGWVAVGDPARLYPPGQASDIRAGLEEAGGFLPFVFGTDPADDRSQQMRTAMRRYASFLSRSHQGDELVS